MHTKATSNSDPLSTRESIPTLSRRLQIVYASDLPGREKSVLAYIAYRVDKQTGAMFVGLKRMVAETGVPKSTLLLRLGNLRRLGWIQRSQRWDETAVTSLLPEKFPTSKDASTGPAAVPPGCEHGASPVPGTGSPQPKDGPLSVSPSVDSSGETKSVSGRTNPEGPMDFEKLFFKIRKTTPDLTRKQFDWMVALISGRAKSLPKFETYYLKAINAFIRDFFIELTEFLFTKAHSLLRDGHPDGEVRERLKSLCAENDLPVTPDLILAALERAYLALAGR